MTSVAVSLKRLITFLETGAQSTATDFDSFTVMVADLEEAFRGAAATTGRVGFIELATTGEAKAGTDATRAVTPAAFAAALDACKVITFAGRNGAGACTATGAVAGDKVVGVAGISGAIGAADASFEATVTVNDQFQQSAAGDLSSNVYLVILRAVA